MYVLPMTAPGSSSPRPLSSLPGPRALPLLGNALDLKPRTMHLQLEEWARIYGDLYLCYLGRQPVLVISNPEMTRKVLMDRPDGFGRIRKLSRALDSLKMVGIFVAEGENWRRQRKLINPGFSPTHLETFFPSLVTITQRLHTLLDREAQQGNGVDVLKLLLRYTVDAISVVSFGVDTNTLENGPDAIHRHIEHIFPAIQQRVSAPLPYWKITGSRKLNRVLGEVRKVVQGFIDAGRRDLEREPERALKPRTLMDAMLSARDEENGGSRLTDDEIFGNSLTLLLGGEETTASTMAWILCYLAMLPEVQARARQEVDATLGTEAVPTAAHLKNMPYMAGLALEAVRMRTPSPLLHLESNQDTVVGDVAVPAGTIVFPLIRLMCMNNSLFGDSESFRPERWLPEPPPDTLPHVGRYMMGFGAGGRVCPGRSLALLECALVATVVLRHFELEMADPNTPVTEVNVFSVQPHGARLIFRRRAASSAA
jgi:cytochrome P450